MNKVTGNNNENPSYSVAKGSQKKVFINKFKKTVTNIIKAGKNEFGNRTMAAETMRVNQSVNLKNNDLFGAGERLKTEDIAISMV